MEFLTEEELRAAIKHELGHYIISFTKTDSYEDFYIELYLSNKFSSGNFLIKTGVSHTDNLYISAAGSVSEVLKDDEINLDEAYRRLTEWNLGDFESIKTSLNYLKEIYGPEEAEYYEKKLLPTGEILNEIKQYILFYKEAIESITDYVQEKYRNEPSLKIILTREDFKKIKGAEILFEDL